MAAAEAAEVAAVVFVGRTRPVRKTQRKVRRLTRKNNLVSLRTPPREQRGLCVSYAAPSTQNSRPTHKSATTPQFYAVHPGSAPSLPYPTPWWHRRTARPLRGRGLPGQVMCGGAIERAVLGSPRVPPTLPRGSGLHGSPQLRTHPRVREESCRGETRPAAGSC